MRATGSWTLDVADEANLTGGAWRVERSGDRVDVSMAVTRPWHPHGLPWSLRLVTTVARVFRDWPTTYCRSVTIELATDPPTMRSSWSRTTGPRAGDAYGVRRARGAAMTAGAVTAVVAGLVVALRSMRRVRRGRPAG